MWNTMYYFSFLSILKAVLKITSEKKHVHLAFKVKFSGKFQELMVVESQNLNVKCMYFQSKSFCQLIWDTTIIFFSLEVRIYVELRIIYLFTVELLILYCFNLLLP